MVPFVNLLHLIGLAHPLATALNKRASNDALWHRVGISATGFLLVLMIGIIAQCVMLTEGIGHSGILLFTLLGSFISTIPLIGALQVADGYQRGKKLLLYPGGAWVMLKTRP